MDTYKWKAWCPTCVKRDADESQQPCLGCGYHPAWPGVMPNNYVPDPEKIAARAAEAVEELPTPKEIEEGAIELAGAFGFAPMVAAGFEENPVTEEDVAALAKGEDPWQTLGEAVVLDPIDEVDETILVVEPERVPLEPQDPEDERVPQVHIDSDNYYHCQKCEARHKYDSGVGKKHLKHQE